MPQPDVAADRLVPLVQAEQDIAARVAGLNALAHAAGQQPMSVAAATFDRDMVPELARIATEPNSPNIQMRAVFALRRARSAAAQTALVSIAANAAPPVAAAARNGLRVVSP